ncbi:hypothetical protein UlMin_035275 [Ulmus minor]
MASSIVKHISDCFIKPQYASDESKHPFYLTPWDLAMLSVHYIQKGLLFVKPLEAQKQGNFMESLLEKLKHSLSVALIHFYPLAGRMKTIKTENPPSSLVYVDFHDSPGARFIHATLDMTISDILSPIDVPSIVQSFFDHDRAVNHDGHSMSLLSIQVTELVDGVFIGCSMNHSIGDGTTYWSFFNMWSEIFQAQGNTTSISCPPVLKRWFPEGRGPIITLPFTHPDEFISRFEAPQLRERYFHFSSESVAKLKAKANSECNSPNISSLQALSAFVWRCITRVRHLPPDQITSCRFAAGNRSKLNPPLSETYFGSSINIIRGFTTAGELLEHDLGWAAWKLHEAVVSHNDKEVRGLLDSWLQFPTVHYTCSDNQSVMVTSSPRFNKYGSEFGMGKAVALRSGYASKFDGKVTCYPGREGGGSIDFEMSLLPDIMLILESNKEFMEATSSIPLTS